MEAQEQWRFAVLCARFRRHEQRWAAERPLILATPAKVKALDPTGRFMFISSHLLPTILVVTSSVSILGYCSGLYPKQAQFHI